MVKNVDRNLGNIGAKSFPSKLVFSKSGHFNPCLLDIKFYWNTHHYTCVICGCLCIVKVDVTL